MDNINLLNQGSWKELEQIEDAEWLESLDYIIKHEGEDRARALLEKLQARASHWGIRTPTLIHTPYLNTIDRNHQPAYPGNRDLEKRIKSIIRWNAMAMVVRANRKESGIGGHISTYASAATLYEVAFHHFFRGKNDPSGGDMIYFQGHASPGIYARAFLEGRLSETQLENFRRELKEGGGLSSYPHPYLMPDFWEFPTVSMGLGPLMAIYQARFNRYLEDRDLLEKTGKVWAFVGDGETDEPETLGAITLASRENLDNLIFVVNCNLQRLDGPVRGNGKIIQELESVFRGAGWNVIKVIWGSNWDPLIEMDHEGILTRRMEEAVDGDYQKYSVSPPPFVRDHFFNKYESLKKMTENFPDDQIAALNRGGHDPEKIYAAYHEAINHKGSPTVILAKTVKGYGLGESGEGKNITHQQKKLNENELKDFKKRFNIPISDDQIGKAPFYRPPENSEEIQYLLQRRKALGGFIPQRLDKNPVIEQPDSKIFSEFFTQSFNGSTTMAAVRILSKLLQKTPVNKYIVPIVPDEARTFGMEPLFRQAGIYSHVGQKYQPVDKDTLLYYREEKWGQILEEGITEAGAFSSFISAGSAYSTHNIPMIPWFMFYSMFGFQRIGDLIWAAGDMKARGFLFGGTSGRTTLAGEGLQHQDGHSHLLAYPYPHVIPYDPAFAYELAVIIEDGLNQMCAGNNNHIRYITVYNESYTQVPAPRPIEEIREGILKGIYKFASVEPAKPAKTAKGNARINIFGSGAMLGEVRKAAKTLARCYGVSSDIWSVTSYKQLYTDAVSLDRKKLISGKPTEDSFIAKTLGAVNTPIVAVSDFVKAVPLSIAPWIKTPYYVLGTDGFGRSESRASLRDFFEVDRRYITLSAIQALVDEKILKKDVLLKARSNLEIDSFKKDPLSC